MFNGVAGDGLDVGPWLRVTSKSSGSWLEPLTRGFLGRQVVSNYPQPKPYRYQDLAFHGNTTAET